jgi:hypothetical protein
MMIAAMALAACGKTKPSTQMTGAAGQGTAGTTGSAGTTGAAGTTATSAVTCDDYCTVMKAACKGANAQYYDQADCMKVCSHLPPGSPTDATGNTVGCRTNAANVAVFETTAIKPSCWAAGPLGFGVCGSECDVFCAIAMSYCSAAEGYAGAPLFASLDECHLDCGEWNRQRDFSMPGAYVATYSPGPTPETADTLECRAYHLLVNAFKNTAAQQVHCPHAANKSEICGSGYVAPVIPDGGTGDADAMAPAPDA